MVICKYCDREMTTAEGCGCTMFKIDYEWMPRIRFGDPGDLAYGYREFHDGDQCPDCACRVGQYHHPGCDMEACPKCGEQMISCNCSLTEVSDPEED